MVEMAVIAPVFLMLIIGIIEFGRLMQVQQILTNASREGARRAVIQGATKVEAIQITKDALVNAGFADNEHIHVTVTPSDLNTLIQGDSVTMSIRMHYHDVSWIGSSWFLGGVDIEADTVMRAERLAVP